MKFELFIEEHWDLFFEHFCQFHPLDKAFIEKYKYDLNWYSLSKNQEIEWDIDLIKKHKDRISWRSLSQNTKIIWDYDFIIQFEDQVDWDRLQYNPNLIVDERLFQRYAHSIYISKDNPSLTEELREKYSSKITSAKLSSLDYPKSVFTEEDFENLEVALLREFINITSKSDHLLYTKYIKPNVEEIRVENLFGQIFDYSQRYFKMSPKSKDKWGRLPHLKLNYLPFERGRFDDQLIDLDKVFVLSKGYNSFKGEERYYELAEIDSNCHYGYDMFIVSENVKNVLSLFKLPPHKFYPAEFESDILESNTKFYVCRFGYDSLTKQLPFSETTFISKAWVHSLKKNEKKVIPFKINNYEEYWEVNREESRKEEGIDSDYTRVEVFPSIFRVNNGFDIFTHRHDLIVPKYVKDVLEHYFPQQIDFSSAFPRKIRMSAELYKERSEKEYKISEALTPVYFKKDKEYHFYYEKMERLKRSNKKIPQSLIANDEFTEIEQRLNVTFPKYFKEFYEQHKDGKLLSEYYLNPIKYFYIENQYAMNSPETFNSVVFAENRIGDSLALVLERDSDFALSTYIYELSHESGKAFLLDLI